MPKTAPKTIFALTLPALLLLGGCNKSEAEKFDDEFEARQAEIDAKAREIEEEAESEESPEAAE